MTGKMKKLIAAILMGAMILGMNACGNKETINRAPEATESLEINADDTTFENTDESTVDMDDYVASDSGTFSNHTVIIMVKDNTAKEEIEQLCEEQNLSILYDYDIILGYALESKNELSAAEMDQLIEALQQYDFVLSAEKDAIMSVD